MLSILVNSQLKTWLHVCKAKKSVFFQVKFSFGYQVCDIEAGK